MILFIDTTKGHNIEIAVNSGDRVVAKKKFRAEYSQAEKLLPALAKTLKTNNIKLSDVRRIKVNNQGGLAASGRGTSFTALRIGVVTANALGYALKIPVVEVMLSVKSYKKFSIVLPIYSKEPNIT